MSHESFGKTWPIVKMQQTSCLYCHPEYIISPVITSAGMVRIHKCELQTDYIGATQSIPTDVYLCMLYYQFHTKDLYFPTRKSQAN